MSNRWKLTLVVLAVNGCFSAGVATSARLAAFQPRTTGAQSTPQTQRLRAGEEEARRLVLLMDKDKNGKVSKKEFMAFMEAEFDRLDTDRSGELDVKELAESQFRTSPPFQSVGK
jgi:hypothetical protein